MCRGRTYWCEIGSFRIFWFGLYGCKTNTSCLQFWPAMCAASMAPADARVSESITKNNTRAFSLARCSSSMRSGVQSDTCCNAEGSKVVRIDVYIKEFNLSYRIVERNAELLQGGYGNVCTPSCRIAGAAQKYLNVFAAGVLLFLGIVDTAKGFCTA